MRKLLFIGVLALAVAAPASGATLVPIVMRDPGCHWFQVDGKYSVRYVSHGAVAIRNLDIAALRVVGPSGPRLDEVGKTMTLTRKGVYHITMVGQARDDNHLVLTVR